MNNRSTETVGQKRNITFGRDTRRRQKRHKVYNDTQSVMEWLRERTEHLHNTSFFRPSLSGVLFPGLLVEEECQI